MEQGKGASINVLKQGEKTIFHKIFFLNPYKIKFSLRYTMNNWYLEVIKKL